MNTMLQLFARRLNLYPPSLTRVDPQSMRVLIVDDEAPVREYVDRVLKQIGYQTVVAASGPEAIAMASTTGSLHALVADVRMPEMNGDEVARQLRMIDPDLKVLYLTGYSDDLFKERVALWNNEVFLDKPCSLAGLREAVALLLFGTLSAG